MKFIKILLIAIFLSGISNPLKTDMMVVKLETESKIIKKQPPKRKHQGGVEEYLWVLGKYESDNNPQVVNAQGMMGRYQFSKTTLKDYGIFEKDHDAFLLDEELQDSIMIKNLRKNALILNKTIRLFHGKTVNGIYITKSGILAGAHLVGPGGVLAYFYPDRYNHATSDRNGTTVAKYMKLFSNYNLTAAQI